MEKVSDELHTPATSSPSTDWKKEAGRAPEAV